MQNLKFIVFVSNQAVKMRNIKKTQQVQIKEKDKDEGNFTTLTEQEQEQV